MKIIIAPDSFKGSITAESAAAAIAVGVSSALPNAEIISMPIADGGEGTLNILVPEEKRLYIRAFDAYGKQIVAEYGILDGTAVIEAARAVGLCLTAESERNPELSTTKGIGHLILSALDKGCNKILLTLGGTGSNDGGCGMLAALGVVFIDENGCAIEDIRAKDMIRIKRIDISRLDRRIYSTKLVIACDVKNPLLGENGATYVYGPQKGADRSMLKRLEAGMDNYSKCICAAIGHDLSALPGTGAGGGIGFPLVSLFSAEICSGISSVLDFYNFNEALHDAELVITGEGRLDAQSLAGKAIVGVAHAAMSNGIRVLALVGSLGEGFERIKAHGVTDIMALTNTASDASYAMSHAATLLSSLAEEFIKTNY